MVRAALLCVVGAGMLLSAASAPIDPYDLYEIPGEEGYSNTAVRAQVSATLDGGESTGVFIATGQSLFANNGESAYTPTNAAKAQQIDIYDGVVYQIKDPVIGASAGAGSMISMIADKLIDQGVFDRVIIVPIAVGGSGIHRWAPGGDLNHRLAVAIKRVRALGYPLHGVLLQQGEYDHQQSTPQATYEALLRNAVESSRGYGYQTPWFIAHSTYVSGVTSSTIRDAQSAVVAADPLVYDGADTDTLTGANRQVDDVHLTDMGNDNASDLWVAAVQAVY